MVQPKLYLNENRGAMRQRFSPDVIVEYCRDRKKQEGIHRSLVGEQSLGLIFCRRLAGRNLSEQPCTDFVGKGKRVFAALDLTLPMPIATTLIWFIALTASARALV